MSFSRMMQAPAGYIAMPSSTPAVDALLRSNFWNGSCVDIAKADKTWRLPDIEER